MIKNYLIFHFNGGFLVYDSVPSEAVYSRMFTIICESNVLEEAHEPLLHQAITEGFITDDTVSIDASHFEAKDQAPSKEEKPKSEPKNANQRKNENNIN